jgi:PIN domain nuclease of toxin-antitoxin system
MFGRRLLLDTQVLLWLVSSPHKVMSSVREVLSDTATELMVSAASAAEIAVKTRLGRLNGEAVLWAWPGIIADMTATHLLVDPHDAVYASRMVWDNEDPFDRVLVAQAARRGLTIVTNDVRIRDAALIPTIGT